VIYKNKKALLEQTEEINILTTCHVTRVTGAGKTSYCVVVSVSSASSSRGQPVIYSSFLSYLEFGLTGIMQIND
jgi:hypothetical protein